VLVASQDIEGEIDRLRILQTEHSRFEGDRPTDEQQGNPSGKGVDKNGIWRLMLCFAIEIEQLQFIETEECVGYEFVAKRDFAVKPLLPQTRPLESWL